MLASLSPSFPIPISKFIRDLAAAILSYSFVFLPVEPVIPARNIPIRPTYNPLLIIPNEGAEGLPTFVNFN